MDMCVQVSPLIDQRDASVGHTSSGASATLALMPLIQNKSSMLYRSNILGVGLDMWNAIPDAMPCLDGYHVYGYHHNNDTECEYSTNTTDIHSTVGMHTPA